jgi:hypothetical protein
MIVHESVGAAGALDKFVHQQVSCTELRVCHSTKLQHNGAVFVKKRGDKEHREIKDLQNKIRPTSRAQPIQSRFFETPSAVKLTSKPS